MNDPFTDSVKHLVLQLIARREQRDRMTLLAVCPNSIAVLEAAIQVAAANDMPMLFAATLNQVDRDKGYTGWTPRSFVARMEELAAGYGCQSPLYPCLDHGGPWLKDAHVRAGLSLDETMAELRGSFTACLEAGYALLHVDPTVDRSLPPGQPPPIEAVVERTVDLVAYAEAERERLGLPPVSYEVGTEEVHGGLVNFASFDRFLTGLQAGLEARGLSHAWPCFVVGKVGTDLHTTTFDPAAARRLYERVMPLGSLIKGHYTDWVANPAQYPATGMGGANVGPEFTAAELAALYALCDREEGNGSPSDFRATLEAAVVGSNRWQKWLTPEEVGRPFTELAPERRAWLVATGARYVWTQGEVPEARWRLYENLADQMDDPHGFVVQRIAGSIQKYVDAFNLRGSLSRLLGWESAISRWGR